MSVESNDMQGKEILEKDSQDCTSIDSKGCTESFAHRTIFNFELENDREHSQLSFEEKMLQVRATSDTRFFAFGDDEVDANTSGKNNAR